MKTLTTHNILQAHTEPSPILSIVHGQPLTTLEHLLIEQSFTLQAMGFLNEVQLTEEFWETRLDQNQDRTHWGLAMAALQLHLTQLNELAQRLEIRQCRKVSA
ncbi:MAG: hypothetical protein R3B95_11635 [Nitrospirales bacterium]|nr:hypothetical protein [Nitrospirales bacterium]